MILSLNAHEKLMVGEVLDKPLAALTSWHIGGCAKRFYMPPTVADLANYLPKLPQDMSCTWLGLGSNVLIPDEGIDGAIICTRQLQGLKQREDLCIEVQAGVTCAKLARFCSRLFLPDAAFFAGIPGTVGGALAMNAGAFGSETWEWVSQVEVINRQGKCFFRESSDFDVSYRSVKGKFFEQQTEYFVSAVLRFPLVPGIDGMAKIRELLRKRAQSQPIGTLNCGSVYRNPPGDFAARLIEACDLKGYRVGGAMVSPKHANFIINDENARASEILALMTLIELQVKDKFGISLQREVKILV